MMFYDTDIKQCKQYIRVYAHSYIGSCLAKLGWESTYTDSAFLVPLTPVAIKTMCTARGTLDPAGIMAIFTKHGFQYRTLTGMLIFDVQIGRFDIAPDVSILCKFNGRIPGAHFQAAKNDMRYLRATIDRGLIYWRPTFCERSDLYAAPSSLCSPTNL
jgi:hypothetical protein